MATLQRSHLEVTPERLEWICEMRRRFSKPEMLNEDGSIRQEYFKPDKVLIADKKRKWGNKERELLYKGLEKYGVGNWKDIGDEFLPDWDDQQLRIKSGRMLGTQSLARYVGWKGDRTAVDEEYERNKQIGIELGCWKGGVLVEDEDGSVRKYFHSLNGHDEV